MLFWFFVIAVIFSVIFAVFIWLPVDSDEMPTEGYYPNMTFEMFKDELFELYINERKLEDDESYFFGMGDYKIAEKIHDEAMQNKLKILKLKTENRCYLNNYDDDDLRQRAKQAYSKIASKKKNKRKHQITR